MSQRALQVHTDPLLGHTELGGHGYVVSEVSPYEVDLDDFGLSYAASTRRDHALFVSAFREGEIGGVTAT